MRNAGYGVVWAASMSIFIFAGSMQYVGVGLLAGGASVLTTVITTVMVNARHLFYSISMIDKYKNAGKYKPYMIFALTDETYSLLSDGKAPSGVEPNLYRFLVSLFNQCLLDYRQRHREFAWNGAAIFNSGNRIFHDGAVCCVVYGTVAYNKGPCPRTHRIAMYALVPCGVRTGKFPDSCNAADYIGVDASAQKRGRHSMNSIILIALMAIVTMLIRFLPFLVFILILN